MASSYKEIPLTFEKGLVTEIEESILDEGQASELTNWEATPQGGLRARNQWNDITTDGLIDNYSVRGLGAVATGTAIAGAISGPQVAQQSHWPNSIDADPVTTKTITLNGVSIGNVLIAIVTDNSNLTPTVTSGWTERAVSTGNRQHVKFYTHTADTSTEVFTYTIATARIRSVSVYEVKYLDAEDPGTKWAAQSVNSGVGGSDNLTVNAVDIDGGLALVGYLYDAGTPNTNSSGTAGYASPTLDNSNPRTGVSFQDLDQLDGIATGSPGNISYVSPSWTPPATGVVIVLVNGVDDSSTGSSISALSVSGNNLTWHDCFDGGELGGTDPGTEYSGYLYAWADCSLVTPTPGSITVTVGSSPIGVACSFVLAIGADTTAPFVQKVVVEDAVSGTTVNTNTFSSALLNGSGVLGAANSVFTTASPTEDATPTVDASNFEGFLDVLEVPNSNPGAGGVNRFRTAFASSAWSPNTTFTWTSVVVSFPNSMVAFEIKGQGNAAKHYRDALTGAGTAIEDFTYVANKEITAKMVVWGHEPPTSLPDTVDFYIVMALAEDGTTYRIYWIPRDDIETGTWQQIDTVTNLTDTSAFVTFAQGAGNLIWSSSTMGYPRQIELATLSQSNITDMAALAGRTAVYHKDRLFIGGSSQNPSRLYFSDIGDPDDFATTTDFIDIGGDDGEAIQDLVSVEGLLLVCKTNRSYLISGSGVESFFVNELPGGSAAPGRPAVRTPFGTILAGEDDVWVVQGGGVDPLSRPLGAGYRITGNATCSYGQDTVLICDSGTNTVWRVNLVTGAWMYEDVTGDDAAVFLLWSLNGRHYYGTNETLTEVGGTRQLLSARNTDETTGDTHFTGSTGRLSLDGPAFQYTPRYLFLQTRSQDITKYNELRVTLTTNLNLGAPYETSIPVREATQRDRLSLGWAKGAEWLKVGFECDSSATAAAIDVEKIVLGVDVEAPR